jgi:uncharacterized protein YciI
MTEDEYVRFVYMLTKIPGRDLNEDVVRAHVAHLKRLDAKGVLELCGPFSDDDGGMVILKGCSSEEAREIAISDPFVKEGYETFELRRWEISCQENNHMGMG